MSSETEAKAWLHAIEHPEAYCPRCGKKRIVDAPPFAEMSDQDKADWKASGGKVEYLECINGCSP